jgi:hypothetical protein
MNLIQIATSLRTVRIWVEGHERAALVAYYRAAGEVVHSVYRVA